MSSDVAAAPVGRAANVRLASLPHDGRAAEVRVFERPPVDRVAKFIRSSPVVEYLSSGSGLPTPMLGLVLRLRSSSGKASASPPPYGHPPPD